MLHFQSEVPDSILTGAKSNTPFYTNLTFACQHETLGSLYSDALLIPIESKYQVVHEQKFKDPGNSTCQVSVER